jgi:DNA invertase Pin-like site-specific DNA recombinase
MGSPVSVGGSKNGAALYLRVSTVDQTTANQERELREVAARMGCEITKVYKGHGVSGAKGRDKRPAFDALCKDRTRRQFDIIMAWSVDRLWPLPQDLVVFLSEIHALEIDLYLHQQGLDTTSPAGKTMFQMMGVFAEFERAMIQERVRAGLARAKAEGIRLGRPKIEERSKKQYVERSTPLFLAAVSNCRFGITRSHNCSAMRFEITNVRTSCRTAANESACSS